MCYPYEISKRINDFGVLEQYKDKKYTMAEINQIVADLIMKNPYISNSMFIKICVMSGMGYHHILDIKNYNYSKQERTDKEVRFQY
jgi:hypothetical protein